MTKNKSTLMRRRTLAIIIAAVLAVALAIALIVVLDYANATAVRDTDGTVYYVRKKNNVHSLYGTDKKTVLQKEEQYGYFITNIGTLVKVDAETGEYEIIAAVDTEDNEQVVRNQRLLMFPHLENKSISKIEVFNSNGSFAFVRYNTQTAKEDNSSGFVIEGSPFSAYDQELLASLRVSAGYTMTSSKIDDPIKDAVGQFSEYGLVPERRVREKLDKNGEFLRDDDGNYIYEEYDYVPAYYIITDISGNRHKVIIGDMLVSGGGYYAQYVKLEGDTETRRDAVYVLSNQIEEALLAPIEDFVTPQLTYPMNESTYLDVDNFTVMQKNPNPTDKDAYLDPTVIFSFIPLSERENSIAANTPFVFHEDFALDGYTVSSDNVNTALMGLYQPAFGEVVKLSPKMSDFAEYGLAFQTGESEQGTPVYEILPEYVLSYNYDVLDESNGKIEMTVNNRIYISKQADDGKYYAYTEIYEVDAKGNVTEDILLSYNMIVEVQPQSLEFLKWDRFDWINSNYIDLNIAFADKITVTDHASGYVASFDLDNSASDMSQQIMSDRLSINATDTNNNSTTTFSQLAVTDESGNIWIITSTDIRCYSPTGNELNITSSYYDYNCRGRQVRANRGAIRCYDGRQITVNTDTIEIRGAQNVTIVRYHTDLFRDYFQTLLYSSISDSYRMSAEEEEALLSDESKLLVTLTIKDTDGKENVYKFYRLTNRKAYITINGNGGFYVLVDRVEKFVTDAQKFFRHELIDATSKY